VVDHRDDDRVLERAVDALREVPPVDAAAVARIVTSAARIREIDAEPHADDLLPAARSWMLRWPTVAAIAASAAVGGYLIGGGRHQAAPETASGGSSTVVVVPPPSSLPPTGVGISGPSVPVAQASAAAADALPIPTQFVFEGRNAKRVALVGDFNGWDESSAPLQREHGSTLWSVTVPLLPGRHVYAFLVDSVWTTDPHAPVTHDPDFGVTSSVVIVGKP
jgi:hypothetical protein